MTTLLLQAKHKHTQFTSCAGCLTGADKNARFEQVSQLAQEELCHTKRADLQAASDGAADGPLRMQQMDRQSFIHLLHSQGTMQSS